MDTFLRPQGMRLMRGLRKNNDRAWFAEHKDIYLAEVQAPYFALIEAVNEAMLTFALDHVKPANKVALRIYRDTRFSNDKRPFKQHFGAWWGRAGMVKTSGAGFYMHIGAKEVVIAAGLFMSTPEQLAAVRAAIAEDGDALRKLLNAKPLRKLLPESESDSLKRVPKGYPAGHPAEDLLRARRHGVAITLPADEAMSPSLAKQVIASFKAATPLVDWLNRTFAPREPAWRKSIF